MSTVNSEHFNAPNTTMIVPHQKGVVVEGIEGSVLMSVSGNVILRLNEVGTLIWEVLEQGRDKDGLEADEVLQSLVPLLEECLTEPIPEERVKRDLLSFLDTLLRKNLLAVIDKPDGKRFYLVPAAVFWSKKRDSDSLSTEFLEESNGTLEIDNEAANSSNSARKLLLLTSLFGLILFDLLTKIYRFDTVHRIIERQSLRSRRKQVAITTLEDVKRICEAVDQAQIYYYKQILCLQRSTVAACLLWRRGIPAELIIAARMIPFQSHAWVEVAGQVVNDHPSVRRRYDSVIERIGASQSN